MRCSVHQSHAVDHKLDDTLLAGLDFLLSLFGRDTEPPEDTKGHKHRKRVNATSLRSSGSGGSQQDADTTRIAIQQQWGGLWMSPISSQLEYDYTHYGK